MLARAPMGTKRWHLWTTYEELQARELREKRRDRERKQGTWLVDGSGALLK